MDYRQNLSISRIARRLARKTRVALAENSIGATPLGPIEWYHPQQGKAIPLVRFIIRTNRQHRRLIGALPEIGKRLHRTSIACGLKEPVGMAVLDMRAA